MTQPTALVGRGDERAAIRRVLGRAVDGEPSFALIFGEAGIGKTRLLQAAADDAHELGLRVLTGTAISSGAGLPFLPLLGLLVEADVPGDADRAALAVRRLVRGRTTTDDTAEGELTDAGSAARLVESIYDVLTRQPTALLLDDIHWADASTLTVLDHASRRHAVPLAMIVAARDDEPGWIQRVPFADGRRFELIHVERLSNVDVAGQISALLGTSPNRSMVERVVRRSAGNPFFVEQLVAAELAHTPGDPTDTLPSSLRILVERRIARLTRSTRRVLNALAVMSRPTDRATLAALAEVRVDDVDAAIDEAIDGGIVTGRAEGADIRHPLFREAIVGRLERAAALALHRRAAETLTASGGTAAEIANHWWRAEDPLMAWKSAIAAGDEAEAATAFAEVRVHLQHALEVWPQGEPGRLRVAWRASRAAWISGDAEGALSIVRDVSAHERADVALLTAQGGYEWDVGERAASAATFERVAPLLDDTVTPIDRSRALWGLGRARVGQMRHAEATALAEQSAAAAVLAGDAEAEAEAWMLYAMARGWDGSLDGIDALVRGLALAEASGAPSPIGQGYQFLVELLFVNGEHHRSLDVALRGVEVSDRLGLAGFHGSDLRGRAALILIDLGRWADADAILAPADPRAYPSLARALLAMRRGDLDRATRELDAAAIGGAIGGPGSLGGWLELAQAELAWIRGDQAAGEAALDAIRFVPGVWGLDVYGRRAWWRARFGPDPALTAERVALAKSNLDRLLGAALVAEIEAIGTEAASIAGDAKGTGRSAIAAWARCAAAWREAERPYEAAHARLREARAAFACGDRDRARAALHEAADVADALGAVSVRILVDDLARRARVAAQAPRRTKPDPEELTPRELEVLRLLADGLTNRGIAERLFLSRKTVGIHVSRILEKLRAHTRGEAAAVARKRGLLE